MNISKTIICLTILISIIITSCAEKVPGCTDVDGDNYDVFATEDDGTCFYSGGVVFWHDGETSDNLVADGITQLKYYVDGVFMDNIPANIYWNSIPIVTCSNEEAFTIENYGLGNLKSKDFTYEVQDQDGNVLSSGTFTINANDCTVMFINY